MWFLPTRRRPQECVALIEAMQTAGDVPKVAVMIDDDDTSAYADVPWPAHWDIHCSRGHMEMTRVINRLLALYPGDAFYGFFGDHFRPLTPMFDALRQAAGDWFMAWPSDGGQLSHRQPAGAPTFGGKLIDLLGWICLPATLHICTDRIWWHLWAELGIVRHLDDARFTRTWPVGRGHVPRRYMGQDVNQHDRTQWLWWRDHEAPAVVAQIREAMKRDGYRFDERGRIAAEYGCLPFDGRY